MIYTEALKLIDSLLVYGSRPGLERITKFLALLDNPQDKLKYVHVAGTNGKGSVSNMIAAILKSAGYKTGLFTSPHIVEFGERMQINGEYIPEADVVSLVERLFPIAEKMKEDGDIITEFEFVTAMAFCWYNEQKCDVVVLETGLGGRFDATNVINTPLCSVITSISLDHQAVLGDTIEKIAFEKAGIIKPDGRTIYALQEDDADEVILSAAVERNNTVHYAAGSMIAPVMSINGALVKFDGTEISFPSAGRHQMMNFSLVISAVDALRGEGFNITKEDVKNGVESVKMPARFEILSENPLVIADGAHNPGGMRALACAIDDFFSENQVICVLGMLVDKDSHSAVRYLKGRTFSVIATTVPDSPRQQSAQQLADTIKDLDLNVDVCENPQTAVDLALELAKNLPKAVIIICGSLYLASALRKRFLN